jgi:hypothetical protein
LDDEFDDDPGDLQDDISDSSDTEATADEQMDENEELMGDLMVESWKKRSERLRADIAIAGWMCSSDPVVMKDVDENHNGEH